MTDLEELLNKAIRDHRDNNTESAEQGYRLILQSDYSHVDANHNLGILLFSLNRKTESIEYFERAVNTKISKAQHLRSYVQALLDIGDLDKAVKVLETSKRGSVTKNELADLRKLCVLKKIEMQNGVPLFFDNTIAELISSEIDVVADKIFSGFRQVIQIGSSRFADPISRIDEMCNVFDRDRSISQDAYCYLQGSHSAIKWKGRSIYKSTLDMSIYTMLIEEMKPDVIIELGSGSGGSAVWMSDIANVLGLHAKILSYDINKPEFEDSRIKFIKFDLQALASKEFPATGDWRGNKLVIEDAHVNVVECLCAVDKYLEAGDYLVIEDSDMKTKEIIEFLSQAKNSYVSDRYYLDFFGHNGTSAKNSIFKVVSA